MNSNKYYTIVGLCVAAAIIIIAVFGFGVFRSDKAAQRTTPAPQAEQVVEQTVEPAVVAGGETLAPEAPYEGAPSVQDYTVTCGDRTFTVSVGANDHMLVQDNGNTYDLYATPAASGVKYTTAQDAKPQVSFWAKGDDATYEVEGATPLTCTMTANKLPQDSGEALPAAPQESAPQEQGALDAPAVAPQTAEAVAVEAAADVAVAEDINAAATLDPATGEIEGIVWQAIEMNDKPLDASAGITLQLQDGRIAGRSGCNRYTGPYEIDVAARSLKVTGPVAGTRMACPGEAMVLEDAFNKLLPTITAYRLDAGNVLVVFAGEEEVLHLSPVTASQE